MKLLVDGLTEKKHKATGLTEGKYYTFMVAARNSVGVSLFSATKMILAAQKPDIPSAPTT